MGRHISRWCGNSSEYHSQLPDRCRLAWSGRYPFVLARGLSCARPRSRTSSWTLRWFLAESNGHTCTWLSTEKDTLRLFSVLDPIKIAFKIWQGSEVSRRRRIGYELPSCRLWIKMLPYMDLTFGSRWYIWKDPLKWTKRLIFFCGWHGSLQIWFDVCHTHNANS